MKNIILKSLLKHEAASNRSSSTHLSSNVSAKPRRENDDWCVIAADGSTSIITCKSTSRAPEANGLYQTTEDPESESETNNVDLPDASEPGVDLSYLNVEKETTSKLIAGMQAMTVDEPTSRSLREITMPSAKTDLKEIFKSDQVCLISLPKTSTKLHGVQSSGISEASSSES